MFPIPTRTIVAEVPLMSFEVFYGVASGSVFLVARRENDFGSGDL
jgi:hypothetical protein